PFLLCGVVLISGSEEWWSSPFLRSIAIWQRKQRGNLPKVSVKILQEWYPFEQEKLSLSGQAVCSPNMSLVHQYQAQAST
uniref:Uncharacterized protein n=1 Tax=Anolis carolinensis TaxID=28377 RepID=A0A803U123_ANOCA